MDSKLTPCHSAVETSAATVAAAEKIGAAVARWHPGGSMVNLRLDAAHGLPVRQPYSKDSWKTLQEIQL